MLTKQRTYSHITDMLDSLFKHATEGIIISDKSGEIVMVNPIAEKQFGYEVGELTGQKIEVLIPRDLRERHVGHREGYLKNPYPRTMGIGMDLYAQRKNGTVFPVEVSLSNFSTSEGNFVMSFVIDISERKKHESLLKKAHEEIQKLNVELEKRVTERTEQLAEAIKELNISRQELEKALKKEKDLNELKSRFITIASHEFRTPLGTILSSAALIGHYTETSEDDKRQKHILRIKSAVNNLTDILNDFLSLSKLEEGAIRNNPEPLFLQEFAQGIVEEIRPTGKTNQKIIHVHIGDTVCIDLDKLLLKNILLNLLSNAIKYSPEGSNIELITECNNDHVFLTIKDNGLGIPEEDQEHLFELFFRAKNAGNIQGSGLGLNIVKKYLDLLGGEISFTSEVEKGTTFKIKIPKN